MSGLACIVSRVMTRSKKRGGGGFTIDLLRGGRGVDVRFLSLRGMKKRDAFVATPMLKFFLFISSSDLDIPIRIKFRFV